MTSNILRLIQLQVMLLTLSAIVHGQSSGNDAGQPPEGWETAGYVIHQSIDIGYRVSEITGSQAMYDTLVDLRTGPRFLDQTLSMQSQNHDGLLFDNLSISSFGWGGDPNNALHVRFDKSKWYEFRSDFRRDQTDFDYNLLANPLNPPTSSPSIPVLSSPHSFYTRRRMSDFDLTILPQSKVDFRFGYSRNNMTGPSYSSVHEGTDALLFQPWNTTLNSYRMGFDFKPVAGTVISYDQFFDYYMGDTTWQLSPFAPALLPGSAGSVELGLPIDTGNKTPCAINPPATSLIDPGGTLTNIACNAYFGYNRYNRIRTWTPTERLSFRTNYFKWLDLNASYAYSDAEMNAAFNEFFNGLVQRSRTRQELVTGPGHATQISNVADFGATFYLPKHLRIVDSFRFWAFRIPETFTSTTTEWDVPGSGSCAPPTCSLLTPISGTTQSAATAFDQTSFNQNWKRNETDLVWDPSKYFGGSIGFRYGNRNFVHVNDFTTGDVDNIVVHEYTPLASLWAKPVTNLRIHFDFEHTNNDNAIVRIGPRKASQYRIRANYTPKPWAVLGGSINLSQASNDDFFTSYNWHNRNYSLTASLMPRPRFSLDLAYNYTSYKQRALICFNDSAASLPVVADAGSCEANGFADSDNPLLTNGYYTSNVNYGTGAVMFKPIARLTTNIGYSITSVGGQTPQFNVLQPFGPLQYNYHQPMGNLAIDLGHNLTAMGAWNYYQYGEKSFVGPTDPRYFHANNETFSLRWAF
ncbi:MAG TPA: hypothetical protein VF753_10340 [Terriglobales bacterium]